MAKSLVFSGSSVDRKSACHAGDATGSVPASRRSPWRAEQPRSSILAAENPMARGAYLTTVHRVTQSQGMMKQPGAHTWAKLLTISGKLCASFLLLLGKWPKIRRKVGKNGYKKNQN